MNDLLHVSLSNAVAATVLAVVAVVTSRLCRRPALTHGLWLLVLLKLVTPAWLRDEVNVLASRLGLRRVPGVWLVPGRLAPMLWSLGGAPRLLVPEELLDGLSAEQRATLLLHELAHLRRRDHWVRLLELLATGLYWWHPVVWWARRELREAEEQCCDAWVVCALAGTGRMYATALLECLGFRSAPPRPLPRGGRGLAQTARLERR